MSIHIQSTDPVAGIQTAITATTPTSITVNVGKGGGGGTGASVEQSLVLVELAFNITSGGTDYVNPRLIIPEPILKIFQLKVYLDLVLEQQRSWKNL